VYILKEKDLIIDMNSPLDEEIATDDKASMYAELEDFSEFEFLTQDSINADCCGSPAENSIKNDADFCGSADHNSTKIDVDCCGSQDHNSINMDACKISDNKDIQAELDCQGRLLTIRVILKNVCPNKKIAVGVLLLEGNKVKGFKAKEIVTPPLLSGHECNHCESVVVCKFCFVLPGSICCPITLTPKIIAHYTNFNVNPC
jgi:hypothetical protein